VPFGTFGLGLVQKSLITFGGFIPAGPYARKMARPLRSLLRHLSTTPIDVTVFGRQRMRLHPRGNACETRILILPHLYDRYELRLLSEMLQPGSVFIDVGANVGIYSIFAALQAGPTGRIIAVEPHPSALLRLRCNVLLNELTTVSIEPIALCDGVGPVSFKINGRNIGNSSIVFDLEKSPDEIIEVPGETLESLVAKHQLTKIDAIKLDVEGAEDRILFPFFANVGPQLWPRLLLVENSAGKWGHDCRTMLIQRGYRHHKIPSRNMVFMR
jgi:FkbM family methyltransferase